MDSYLGLLQNCAAVLMVVSVGHVAMAAEKPFAFGKVRFEENRGQTDASVRYLARARGQQVFFTDRGVLLSPGKGDAVRIEFVGAGKADWKPAGPQTDSISYFVGSDRSRWVNAAPVYDRIVWRAVYPGVDVAFYANEDRLEYDLILAPGADPAQVRMRFDGKSKVHVSPDGSVELGALRQRTPAIYQELSPGNRRKVDGKFVAAGNRTLALKLAAYERARALVVDPVVEMATYIGGENDDEVVAVTDGFVAGNTRSVGFPGAGASLRFGRDIFVRAATGSVASGQLLTFIGTLIFGGSGDEELAGIGVSTVRSGVILGGTTSSQDLPLTNTSKYHGGASDGFIAYVTTSQGRFAYLSSMQYIGGSGEDHVYGFAGNDSLQVLVGSTDSSDLPVSDVPQKTIAGGKDGFYAILAQIFGNTATYGYIGGSGDDAAYAVSLRGSNQVWIGGETRSADFPAVNPGLSGDSDAFLTQVSTSSFYTTPPSAVKVTTWRIGGSGEDAIRAITATPATTILGNSFTVIRPYTVDGVGFAGSTTSPDFPVVNAAQAQMGGDRDAFVGMWDPTSGTARWLTFLGGSARDEATGLAQNFAGDLYVGGWTLSTDLPVVQPLQPASAGGEDGMFAIYDYTGKLQHLTYYGGSGDDRVRAVGIIYNSIARLVGSTTSSDLPQPIPQDRGGQMDGFVADIGSDYLIGPTELVLAKDGLLSFSVRAARTVTRQEVTYQTSDPSKVRLVFLGKSTDSVTAALEDNIAIEGLTDSGDATITISAPGFASKTVHVKLYPGAYVYPLGMNPVLSTWNTASSLFATYCPYDPAANKVVGVGMSLRYGVPPPTITWSISDPSIFDLSNNTGSYQLHAIKPGQATLTLNVDGYQVLGDPLTMTAVNPQPSPQALEIRLGKDLYANLSVRFTANGVTQLNGYRGTLTAHSADPSRLLLSLAPDQVGRESVSLTMAASAPPVVWIQALADDGQVPVVFTSSEFDGEVSYTVTLEPSVLKWGFATVSPAGVTTIDTSATVNLGGSPNLTMSLQGASGSFSSGVRPGAAPVTVRMTNSNPQVLELNRLTVTLGPGGSGGYTLRGISPGTADLTLASDSIQPSTPSVHVTVPQPSSVIPTLISTMYVGKGLQTAFVFGYTTTGSVDVNSDDASAILVSTSLKQLGSDHITIPNPGPATDTFTFYLQGLKSDGATNVHVHFGGDERVIRVISLPSGVAFTGPVTVGVFANQQEVRADVYALDPQSGIAVYLQTPQPGPGIPVRVRTEGFSVSLNQTSAVLTADAREARFDFSPPPAGETTTFIVESDLETPVSPYSARIKVSGPALPSGETTILTTVTLSRDEMYPYSSFGGPLTITSSDPSLVLVSTSSTAAGSASVQVPAGTSAMLYTHGMADSGKASVLLVSPTNGTREIDVSLRRLQLQITAPINGSAVPLGGTADFSALLAVNLLRPGAPAYHFSVRMANPGVATVDVASFDLGGNNPGSARLRLTGVSLGTTQILVDGPPEIFGLYPYPVSVTAAQSTAPIYSLGKNLQGLAQIDLGAGFSNPNGAIVTLTSTDPGKLLLSRSATTPGTASVNIAVAANTRQAPVYFQTIGEGDATIQSTISGVKATAATVHVANSWVSCGTQAVSLAIGATQSANCLFRYPVASSAGLSEVGPRVGLADLTLRVASSAPDVFTVSPPSVTMQTTSATAVTLRGVGVGTGQLTLTPPPGFGAAPDGTDVLPVNVALPRLTLGCNQELVLGKDTQITCVVGGAASGVAVTAVSGNASLVAVSNDQTVAGAGTATAVSTGNGVSFTLQGLGSFGTAEVLVSAPGYQSQFFAVALRQTEFYLSNSSFISSPASLHVGGSLNLTYGMRVNSGQATPRAGANVPVDIVTDPSGIVTATPSRLVFNGPQTSIDVQVKAVAPGSTLLRLSVPEGFLVPTTPFAISVLP
jgi:hypothetical protein